jgi:O-antigen/teichoic acid export membrane protein
VSPEEYGAFALAFAVYSLVVSLTQATSAQVVVIRYSGSSEERQLHAGAAAAGFSVLLGAVCAAIAMLFAPWSGAPVRSVLLALAVLLPALVLQDTWRTVFVARGAPRAMFANDMVWVLLQAAAIACLLLFGVDTAWPYVMAWSSAALLAGLLGTRRFGRRPTYRTAGWWMREHREVSLPSLANALAGLGTTQVAFVLIAALGGLEDVGALRAAQTVLGPLNIVGFAATGFAVPEIVRRDLSRQGLWRAAMALSAFILAVDAVWGGLVLLVPDEMGAALFGETWANARDALPGMVLFTCLIGITVGASAVTRALNWAEFNFWVSAMLGPAILLFAVLGVVLDGAAGAAYGFAAAAGLVAIPCWILTYRAITRGRRATSDVAETVSTP